MIKMVLENIGRNILGAACNVAEEIFPLDPNCRKEPVFVAPGYTFVRTLKYASNHTRPTVEEFVSPSGVPVVVKTLKHRFQTSCAIHLVQESNILRMLSQFPDSACVSPKGVRPPRLIEIYKSPHTFSIVVELLSGASIANQDIALQKVFLERVIMGLRSFTQKISIGEVGQVSDFQRIVAFPYYLLRTMIRCPDQWRLWVAQAISFYQNILSPAQTRYVLTHYDLSPENIYLDNDQLAFFDFGRVGLAPEEVEIALVGRRYWKLFTPQSFIEWLICLVPQRTNRRRLVAFTSYYWLQNISFSVPGDKNEMIAVEYLKFFSEKVAPLLLESVKAD